MRRRLIRRLRPRGIAYLTSRWRCVDRPLALAGLVFLAPVMLAMAVVVVVLDGRPVVVRLERIGRGGTPFLQLKIRTMREESGGASITSGADRRITPFGALLRRYRLDELPQLANIAKGQMALIGPRPETPDMVDGAGHWPVVLRAKPGMAGATQSVFARLEPLLLRGDDHQRTYREEVLPAKLEIDRWYVEHASPSVDLLILRATFGAITGRGAVPAALERMMPSVAELASRADRSA